jgi:hypothetical protein
MLGTVLGLLPILLGGTPEQCGRLLAPFLRKSGTPLAGFCSSEGSGHVVTLTIFLLLRSGGVAVLQEYDFSSHSPHCRAVT